MVFKCTSGGLSVGGVFNEPRARRKLAQELKRGKQPSNLEKTIKRKKSTYYKAIMSYIMEKSSSGVVIPASKMPHLKTSQVKLEPAPIKSPPTGHTLNDYSKGILNKENSTSRDQEGSLDEEFEDSGYLSLQTSQADEEDYHVDRTIAPSSLLRSAAVTRKEKTTSPKQSPFKCRGKTNTSCPLAQLADSPPLDRHWRTVKYSLSSTPSAPYKNSPLPIVKFQEAVCEELAKSYRKSKRFDWSIVTKVAESHRLDCVIGRQMGCKFVDIFSSLLSKNMRHILTKILALLGDMDLIRCKKVSRTWRKITCELDMCERAEMALKESRSSLKEQECSLTRDMAMSRVVLSCMQTLASSSTISSSSSSSSSTPSLRVNRRAASSQKCTPPSQRTRFNEYLQTADRLKQHESLRACRRCGSPATHSPEAQRATCTRLSCLFDFCTQCQGAFHGSTPCRVVQPRLYLPTSKSAPIIPGSRRSLRRL